MDKKILNQIEMENRNKLKKNQEMRTNIDQKNLDLGLMVFFLIPKS